MFKACQMNCNEDSKRHKSSLGTSINQGQLSKHKATYVYTLTFNSVVFATVGTYSLILFSNLFIYLLKRKASKQFQATDYIHHGVPPLQHTQSAQIRGIFNLTKA